MRNIASVMAIVISLSAPALAQKAEIDANNAKWIELFNNGDFSGIETTGSSPPTSGTTANSRLTVAGPLCAGTQGNRI
ncbi:hypothetical protein ACVWYH_009886 [Bradyrhizobium sp. GM24.11]